MAAVMRHRKIPDVGSCFFCMDRQGIYTLRPKPPGVYPDPIPPDTIVLICDKCRAELSAAQMTAALNEYAEILRLKPTRN